MLRSILLGYLLSIGFVSFVQNNLQQSNTAVTGELRYTAPPDWLAEKPSSKARVAQYKLPKAEGDKEDAQLVIYYFGATEGGSASANIERWISQVEQPEGTSEKPRTETFPVNGLKISSVDVAGTYIAEMAPGSTERHNDPNYRLRAAVIETPKGSYYLKLVGPQKTVERWAPEIDKFVRSFVFK